MSFAVRATFAVSVAIGLCVPNLGHVATPSPQPIASVDERCESAATQSEAYDCYVDAAAKAKVEIGKSFKQNLRIAIANDKDFNSFARLHRMHRSALVEHLKASQAAWLKYSKSQCFYEGGSSHGGSGTGILEAACHYRLNSQRLAELRVAGKLLCRVRGIIGCTDSEF